MRNYAVAIEVAGPLAMFSRPDTGGAPTSYPCPTWPAAKAIFESITFFSDGQAWINPTKVEICRRCGDTNDGILYQRYTTNYGGPLRKASLMRTGTMSGGSSMQLFATVLFDVCYRIHGEIVGPRKTNGINARHYLQDLFNRRLRCRSVNQGGCHRTPSLGLAEMTCEYWGPFRCRQIRGPDGMEENVEWKKYCETWDVPFSDITEINTEISQSIPSLLNRMWNQNVAGDYAPSFSQDVKLKNGVLNFPTPHGVQAGRPEEVADDA
jgi:CRISPR-associated protein Cas5d